MRLRRDSVADGTNPLSKRTESFTSLYQPLTQNSRQTDSTYKPLQDFLILKQITLNIKQGEFVCIIGDVGSGKTSLLNCMSNDMMYTNGFFYSQHCHSTIDDIREELLSHSKKQLASY